MQFRSEEILTQLQRAVNLISERVGEAISEHPHIASWRDAYRQFGSKASSYPSSVENLVKRIRKGYVPGHINKLVDIYNLISLKHLVPAGGEDLDQIRGDMVLTFADENELPIHLLGESESRAPYAGEVIYRDDNGAICRRWNWKEAERTKLTEQTQNAMLVIEALPPVSRQDLQSALNELGSLVRQYCGGEAQTAILDADLGSMPLD